MAEQFHVRIEKESLVFSAGHFITFNGDVCERLHGHNYGVAAEVAGPLDENQYVVDFIALRDSLRSIVDGLDHYMLLPTQHQLIKVTASGEEVLQAQMPPTPSLVGLSLDLQGLAAPLSDFSAGGFTNRVPQGGLRAFAGSEHDGGNAGSIYWAPAASDAGAARLYSAAAAD